MRCVSAWRASDSTTGMSSCAAEIKPVNRRPVLRPTRYRTHKKKLLQSQIAMEDIALRQTIGTFQIERREHLPCHDSIGNVRRVLGDLLYYPIAEQFTI